MNGRHVSMFMMTVTIAYSAPLEYEYDSIETTTSTSKPILRRDVDNSPGQCCSNKAQRCCPYDYDDHCETMDNRNLCGYNKNEKYPEQNETLFTKFGLPCRINDDRVECGYNGPYITDIDNPMPHPTGNPSGCCHCCDKETTTTEAPLTSPTVNPSGCCNCCDNEPTTTEVTVTYTTPKTTEGTTERTSTASTKTTEPTTESTEATPIRTNSIIPQKLTVTTSQMTPPGPPVTKCQTVEEECRVVFEQPCIMDAPCSNDYPEWNDE